MPKRSIGQKSFAFKDKRIGRMVDFSINIAKKDKFKGILIKLEGQERKNSCKGAKIAQNLANFRHFPRRGLVNCSKPPNCSKVPNWPDIAPANFRR